MTTIVLFSGGLDSTALAYHARAVWGDPVHLLSFEYGQRRACARTCVDGTSASMYAVNARRLEMASRQGAFLTGLDGFQLKED